MASAADKHVEVTNAIATLTTRVDALRRDLDGYDAVMEKRDGKLEALDRRHAESERAAAVTTSDLAHLAALLKDLDAKLRAQAEDVHGLAKECALTKQRADDVKARYDTLGTRAWTVITIFITATLSLVAGLVLATLKK